MERRVGVDADLGVGAEPLGPGAGEEQEVDPGAVAVAEPAAELGLEFEAAGEAGGVGEGGGEERPLDPRVVEVADAGVEELAGLREVVRRDFEELAEAGRVDAEVDEGAEVPDEPVVGAAVVVDEGEEPVTEARRQGPALDRLQRSPERVEAVFSGERGAKDLGDRREGDLDLAGQGPSRRCRGRARQRRGVAWGELLRLRLSFIRLGNLGDRSISSFDNASVGKRV